MYNEYLQELDESLSPLPSSEEKLSTARQNASGGGLLQLLTDRLGGVNLNTDTLVAIAVVWFLLSDGKALDTDLLIVIGVLLLLGI